MTVIPVPVAAVLLDVPGDLPPPVLPPLLRLPQQAGGQPGHGVQERGEEDTGQEKKVRESVCAYGSLYRACKYEWLWKTASYVL